MDINLSKAQYSEIGEEEKSEDADTTTDAAAEEENKD